MEEVEEGAESVAVHRGLPGVQCQDQHLQQGRQLAAELLVMLHRHLSKQAKGQFRPNQPAPAAPPNSRSVQMRFFIPG